MCTFVQNDEGALPSLQGRERQQMQHRLLLILGHKIVGLGKETKNIWEEIWILKHYGSNA